MSQPRLETSIESENSSAWREVHVSRYLFAVPYVENRLTLDIACGTGYGLAMLQKHARRVIGVEVDMRAAREAQTAVKNSPAVVFVADGCRLPFADGAFDVITSFETIEHLEDRRQFVAELRRVLSPEGLCILSTPNANHTQPVNGKPRHPYHIHEYTPEELQAELSAHFAHVEMLGQALDARFIIPPFWDEQEQLSKSPGMRKHVLMWRALNKVPFKGRDLVSRALWGQPVAPRETDYYFSLETVNTAPVLVALCRNFPTV